MQQRESDLHDGATNTTTIPRRRSLHFGAFVCAGLLALGATGAGCSVSGDDDTDDDSDQASSALDGEVTIFTAADVPQTLTDPDTAAVELGVRFRADVGGVINGLRFYKSRANTGTHVGQLWSNSGQLLGRVVFSAETRSGWQTARFTTPITIQPGVTYVASYQAPVGRYSSTTDAFASAGIDRGPLHALRDGADGPNGVYRYGSSSFPTSTWHATNYFVDVLFKPNPGGGVDGGTGSDAGPGPDAGSTDGGPGGGDASTPPPGSCVGQPNTPGGPDPWGGCWPGPQNTGYPKGLPGDRRTPVVLTPYTGPTTIRSCGVVIDSKIVNESLIIEAGNGTTSKSTPCVTIRNSLVKGVVYAERSSYGPTLIEDTEVFPPDLPWWENIGRSNVFVYRVDSHGGEGVIKCDTNCEAKDNWVHGMRLGGEYHYNAFGGNGTDGFRIEHNYATCGDWDGVANPGSDAGCSAVIGFYGDFGPIQNVTINRNHLASTFDVSASGVNRQAGYCLNPGYYPGKPYPAPKNMTITDNVFGRGGSNKCGAFGPTNSLNAVGKPNGNIWSSNRYDDGAAIGRPEE